MLTMRLLVLLLVVSCGGSSVEWAGKWAQPVSPQVRSYVDCTLGGSGQSITGSGIQHREAGTDLGFTVSGNACKDVQCLVAASVTFSYTDSTAETFSFSQPDPDHITLVSPQRTVDLVRQP